MKLRAIFDALLIKNRRQHALRRRTLRKFADEMGFVYFGSVDQHTDEHKVVRGFTISSTHKDDSYIVGEHEGFSIAMVDRFDAMSIGRKVEKHAWLVVEIELEQSLSLPHTFLLPTHQTKVHYNKIFTAFRSVEKVAHSASVDDFHSRYELFSTPDRHEEVEALFTTEMIRTIAAHFWPIAVEINGSQIHFYYADNKLTDQLLHTLIQNSVWLCQTLEQSTKED